MSFTERLHALLDGRQKYPWGAALGLNRGVVGGMFDKGVVPKWETLNAIRRAENVSPTWLTEGEGSPYCVARFATDADCAEALAAYLSDEAWNVVVVTDHAAALFVLWQPAAYTMTPKEGAPIEVAYRAIEVLAGGGQKSMQALRDHIRGQLALEQMSSARTAQIAHGEVGTWRLFLAPDAWLRNAAPIGTGHVIFDWPAGDMQLTPEERSVVEAYRSMAPDQRTHFKAVGDALAQPLPAYKAKT